VSQHLHAVFSQPPAGVSDEDFNAWYDAHVREILAVRGFVSVQRYRLEPVVRSPDAPIAYRYLALYAIEGNPADAVAALGQVGMGSKDSYSELKDADEGQLPLPEWFGAVEFASCNCLALGERIGAA